MYITSGAVTATAALFTPSPLTRASNLQSYVIVVAGNGDTQLQRWSSFIGIITAIVGNILISFALNIQRYAHIRQNAEKEERQERQKISSTSSKNGYGTTGGNGNGMRHAIQREDAEEDVQQETDPLTRSFNSSDSQDTVCPDGDHVQDPTYLRSPYWWAGILLMTIGETGNFLAYGFAPASIVSPLGVVALISNCMIAPFMLKERFRWRDFWGVVVAVGGAVTVVLSAKQKEKKLGPHEVIGAISATEFEVYMGITFVLIGILVWASPKYGNRTILIDLGLVGLFGGYTALATKGVASMLSSTLWMAFTTPVTYALVAVLIGTAVMQVKYVNKALQRFDSTQVIPVQFVLFTLSVIIGSAVLYRDFEKTTPERAIKFVGGCSLTFFGVFLITSGRDSQDDEDEEDEESEERIGLVAQDSDAEREFYQDESFKHKNSQHMQHGLQETLDGTDDEDEISPDTSRRSSRVSFAATPTRPSIRFTPSVEASFGSTGDSPLMSNPWKTSQDDLLQAQRPLGILPTTSLPVLPSEAQIQPSPASILRPTTPRISSHGKPHTHPNHQNPNGPPQVADTLRPATPVARHSLSLLPGPFISPLSSSLAAVVADSLRRGVDSPLRNRSYKRPRLSMRSRKTGSVSERQGSESAAEESESPVKGGPALTSQSLGSNRGEELMKRGGRARSLSNALDFLRGKRGGKRENNEEGRGEGEAGPSGRTS